MWGISEIFVDIITRLTANKSHWRHYHLRLSLRKMRENAGSNNHIVRKIITLSFVPGQDSETYVWRTLGVRYREPRGTTNFGVFSFIVEISFSAFRDFRPSCFDFKLHHTPTFCIPDHSARSQKPSTQTSGFFAYSEDYESSPESVCTYHSEIRALQLLTTAP